MEHIFPKWFYHKEIKPDGKIIYSKEEFVALGEGWKETPAAFTQESDEAPEKSTGDQAEGEQGKAPIAQDDFAKMTVAQIKEFLINSGVAEDELKGLKKDQLIAKVGEL